MLSEEQQAERTKLYLKWQKLYNKTKNKDILWKKLRPLLIDMIGNCAKKKCKNNFIEDFEWRVENQAERVIKRYIDNPSYNRDYPMVIAYWESVNMLYGDNYYKNVSDIEIPPSAAAKEYTDEKIIEIRNLRILLNYSDMTYKILTKASEEEINKVKEALAEWTENN